MNTVPLVKQQHGSQLTERVAEEVRALMARRGVIQAPLAHLLDVSQSQVSKRLRGQIPFDVNELGILAEFFGVDPAALLGPPNSPRPEAPGSRPTGRYADNVLHIHPDTTWLDQQRA